MAKSGTDFRDLTEILLTLSDTPAGSIRKKAIKSIKGQLPLAQKVVSAYSFRMKGKDIQRFLNIGPHRDYPNCYQSS